MDSQIVSSVKPTYQFITLLLFFVPLILLLLKQRRVARPKGRLPPSPWKLPIIGNLHQLGSMPHHSLLDLSLKHGPLMSLQLGSVSCIVISTSDIAREVFKSHDLAFSGRPPQYAAKKLTYGFLDMAFAPYGEYWRQARKICMLEVLSLKRVQSFRGVREEEIAALIAGVRKSSASSCMISLSELMLALANNISSRIMFGDKYGGKGYGEGPSKFHGILGETQKLLGGFCVADFFPRLEWIEQFTGLNTKLEKNFQELDGFYNGVIDEHLNRRELKGNEVEDLVHVLLRLQKDPSYASIFTSRNHIKGLLTDMFIAGTDTSSATIIWTMTELMRHPTVMNTVQEELQNVIGNKGIVEEKDLEQLFYFKLVIKEALRLHPPVPLLVPRETTETCTVNGYTIPAQTRVFINAKAIAMDPRNWKEPTKFIPERFLDSNVDFRGQDFELIPFGFGRRGCPGINFALVLVELALANILHCFRWELPKGMGIEDLDLEEAFGLTMHKKNPLCLVANAK